MTGATEEAVAALEETPVTCAVVDTAGLAVVEAAPRRVVVGAGGRGQRPLSLSMKLQGGVLLFACGVRLLVASVGVAAGRAVTEVGLTLRTVAYGECRQGMDKTARSSTTYGNGTTPHGLGIGVDRRKGKNDKDAKRFGEHGGVVRSKRVYSGGRMNGLLCRAVCVYWVQTKRKRHQCRAFKTH